VFAVFLLGSVLFLLLHRSQVPEKVELDGQVRTYGIDPVIVSHERRVMTPGLFPHIIGNHLAEIFVVEIAHKKVNMLVVDTARKLVEPHPIPTLR